MSERPLRSAMLVFPNPVPARATARQRNLGAVVKPTFSV
jgi:hypothetical protein